MQVICSARRQASTRRSTRSSRRSIDQCVRRIADKSLLLKLRTPLTALMFSGLAPLSAFRPSKFLLQRKPRQGYPPPRYPTASRGLPNIMKPEDVFVFTYCQSFRYRAEKQDRSPQPAYCTLEIGHQPRRLYASGTFMGCPGVPTYQMAARVSRMQPLNEHAADAPEGPSDSDVAPSAPPSKHRSNATHVEPCSCMTRLFYGSSRLPEPSPKPCKDAPCNILTL